MKRLFRHSLFVLLALVTACALTTKNPSTQQTQSARTKAAKLVDALTVGVKQVDTASAIITEAPVSQDVKNDINCTILKALGVDNPTPTVTRVCGALPTIDASPFKKATKDLHDLTTDAQLATTVAVVVQYAKPVWDKMLASPNKIVSSLGAILKAAFEPFLS